MVECDDLVIGGVGEGTLSGDVHVEDSIGEVYARFVLDVGVEYLG